MHIGNYINSKKKYFAPILVSVICAFALYLRLNKLAGHDLWADEYWQINQMKGSFMGMIRGFPGIEFCSYLSGDFYLIYPFFKIFGENKWGLAIPHIISTLLGFYLLYLLCKRYFQSIWGYIITFSIICFNATMINHATEIRTYAVLPTLALACLYFWLKLADADYSLSWGKKAAIGLFFILTIWFHAYGILIFSFTGLYALMRKVREMSFVSSLRKAALFTFTILCIALPLWCLSVFGPHLSAAQFGMNTFEYIPNPMKNSAGFLKSVFGNLMGYKNLYFLLAGVFVPFLIPYKKRFEQIAFLFILILIPVGVVLVGNIVTHYWFIQRLFIWVMPFFALFIGWTWDSFIVFAREKLVKFSKSR